MAQQKEAGIDRGRMDSAVRGAVPSLQQAVWKEAW